MLPDWIAALQKPSSRWRRPAVWAGGLGLLLLGWVAASGLGQAPAGEAANAGPVATGGLVVDVLLKLGLVITLIYVSLYLLRRWQGGEPGAGGLFAPRTRQVTLLETTRLSPRQALHLIRAGGQMYLIGATDQGVTLLAEVEPAPAPLVEPAAQPAAPAFAAALVTATQGVIPTQRAGELA